MAIFKKKGNWWIDYDAHGRRYREKIGLSKTLAINVLHKRKAEIAENKFLDIKKVNKVKFVDFADEYFELHCKENNRSWKSDFSNIVVLKRRFSGLYLHEITSHVVEKFKAMRSKEVTQATVNRQLACLKSMFNKAIAWGKFSGTNPVYQVKLYKENNQRTRFLEKEEIKTLLSNSSDHLRPFVIISLNTGMRKGELFNLKWRDIDYRRGIISLYNTKNGEKREIPMNEAVKTALISIKKKPDSQYVVNKEFGRQYKKDMTSFFTALKKSGIKSGIKNGGVTWHTLRHTFASHLVMSGVDLNTVRELMGHKKLEMTLRYSHLSPSHKQGAVDVLNAQMDTIWTPEGNKEDTVNDPDHHNILQLLKKQTLERCQSGRMELTANQLSW